MYCKLALGNIRKSLRDYGVYFLTLAFGVCVFYAFNSIQSQALQSSLNAMQKEMVQSLGQVIAIVSIFVAVVLGFLIVYANRFLIRRRTKEFGIYLTLGMDRRHVSLVLIIETVLIGVISLGVGLVLGILLSQGLSIVTIKMFQADVSKFSFVFSSKALLLTLAYFGLVFLVVILFSAVTVSRYKLIDLINADKKVETLKSRSFWISVPAFIVSIGCIVASYLVLGKYGLFDDGPHFALATVLVVVGTLLFFFSLSGFLLRMTQAVKGVYLRGLNMFVLRQFNSKINTTFVSVSLICLLLFFAISIFAGGMGIAQSQNESIASDLVYDASFVSMSAPKDLSAPTAPSKFPDNGRIENVPDLQRSLKKEFPAYSSTVASSLQTDYFTKNGFLGKDFFPEKVLSSPDGKKIISNEEQRASEMQIVPLSQYNALRISQGKDPVSLGTGEYVLDVAKDSYKDMYERAIPAGYRIKVGDQALRLAANGIQAFPIQGDSIGTIIVPDKTVEAIAPDGYRTILSLTYKGGADPAKFEDEVNEAWKLPRSERSFDIWTNAQQIRENSTGSAVIISYLAIYIGFVLLITCAAVLALQQLSEASDNVTRYRLLSKIGTESGMVSGALLGQVGIYFAMPVLLALVHSYIALREVEKLATKFGGVSISTSMLTMSIVVLIVYALYFLITYAGARTIIRSKPAR